MIQVPSHHQVDVYSILISNVDALMSREEVSSLENEFITAHIDHILNDSQICIMAERKNDFKALSLWDIESLVSSFGHQFARTQ